MCKLVSIQKAIRIVKDLKFVPYGENLKEIEMVSPQKRKFGGHVLAVANCLKDCDIKEGNDLFCLTPKVKTNNSQIQDKNLLMRTVIQK